MVTKKIPRAININSSICFSDGLDRKIEGQITNSDNSKRGTRRNLKQQFTKAGEIRLKELTGLIGIALNALALQ